MRWQTMAEQDHGNPPPQDPQVQVDTPPYDDRKQEFSTEDAERSHKAFDADNAPSPGPAVPVSDEERTGTSSTDIDPEPALDVGESTGRRAEDIAPDRPDTESRGAGRQAGKAADDEAF
jgi:hypothetical protein